MKVAAANAIAELARQQVPEEVAAAYGGSGRSFGPEYIIPAPFDPRLIETVPMAVAKAAMETGVALRPIKDEAAYQRQLRARLNPTTAVLASAHQELRANPRRVIFAEAEEETVSRAAIAYKDGGYGTPVLVGREDAVRANLQKMGANPADFEIHNARVSPNVAQMVDQLYARLQRRGYLRRDCMRLVNQDRHVFSALMLEMGLGDALVTGMTRTFRQTMLQVKLVIDAAEGHVPSGMHMLVARDRTIFIGDTTVSETPDAEALAAIAAQTAEAARRLGQEPRVAFLSYSTFGSPQGQRLEHIRKAVRLLDSRNVNFEYEGEMAADVALNPGLRKHYPFNRLSGPANVLIMPGLHSAHISAKLLREVSSGGNAVIGPFLLGMAKPVQVASMTSTSTDLVTMAVLAAAGFVR
jgi:malate dehydrogenase (oxaloacetate-decarboxylating)(NADP+)